MVPLVSKFIKIINKMHIIKNLYAARREAAKKVFFLSGPATKREGGKGCATKEKRI